MFTRCLAADLKEASIPVVGIGPGYVLTDMTRTSAGGPTLTPADTVPNMIALLERLTMHESGQFFEQDGTRMNVLL